MLQATLTPIDSSRRLLRVIGSETASTVITDEERLYMISHPFGLLRALRKFGATQEEANAIFHLLESW